MRSFTDYAAWMHSLDEFSRRRSPVHAIHPVAALTAAAGFLVAVMSLDRYSPAALAPLFLYPAALFALSGLPAALLVKPLLIAEPFVLCVGILTPWFDGQPLPGDAFARGWLALASMLIKCGLAVSAGTLLAATLGMDRVAAALRRFGLPRALALQLLLTYRYLWVFLEEAGRMTLAYELRAGGKGGIRVRDWGALAGGLFLRAHARAERVHQAMLLRGFDGEFRTSRMRASTWRDWAFAAGWLAFFVLARAVNLPLALGAWATGASA